MFILWWHILNVLAWAFGLAAVYALRAEFAPRAKTWFLLTQAVLSCVTMEVVGLAAPYARGLEAYAWITGIAAGLLMWLTVRSLLTDLRAGDPVLLPAGHWDRLFAGLAAIGAVTALLAGASAPRMMAAMTPVLRGVHGGVWLVASGWIILVVARDSYSEPTVHIYTPYAFALAFVFAFAESAVGPLSRLTGVAIPPEAPLLIGTLFVLTLVVTVYGLVIRVRGHKLAETQKRLRSVEQQLFGVEKLSAVSSLAAGAAHDFNNALTAIAGFIDLARQDESLSPETRENLAYADMAARSAATTTTNLLGIARRQTRSGVYRTVREAVQAPLEILRRDLQMRHIEIVARLDDVPSTGVDLALLSQICLNLFLNARDAMLPKAGGTLDVALGARDDEVEITVRDTGTGIPASFQPRLFEPLQTTKGDRGTGLGLSTSRTVLQAMGGRITYETAEQHGTTFRVFLPVRVEAPVAETVATA